MAEETKKVNTRRNGSITKIDDGRWLVQVFLGRDQDGKQKRHKKTIHGTKKEAQVYLNGVLREQDMGRFVQPTGMTLNSFLDMWLETAARPKLATRTFEDYQELLNRYARRALGHLALDKIQPMHIQDLYSKLLQERSSMVATVRKLHVVISSALKQAVRWRKINYNPAHDVELPRQQKRRKVKAMTAEQAGRFLAAAAGTKMETLFHFAFMTGMRPEEYLGLSWADVDLAVGVVRIERVLVHSRRRVELRADGDRGWSLARPKTATSIRSIAIPGSLVARLQEHRATQDDERRAAGNAYAAHDFVFADQLGGPLNGGNLLRRHFKPLLKKAGLPSQFNLYSARHTCATLLLAAGENVKVISERLGHASVVLTLDTYASVLPTMQRAASERLEAALYGARL